MCKVKDIEQCQKKIFIQLNNGMIYSSDWFSDSERKNSSGKKVFTGSEKIHYEEIITKNNISDEEVLAWSVNREKNEDDCIYISKHAFARMKERNGWNKKTALRMVKKVYDDGLEPDKVKGEYKRWVKQRAAKHPESTYKFYGQNLYVFDNNVLITVIHGIKIKEDTMAC